MIIEEIDRRFKESFDKSQPDWQRRHQATAILWDGQDVYKRQGIHFPPPFLQRLAADTTKAAGTPAAFALSMGRSIQRALCISPQSI